MDTQVGAMPQPGLMALDYSGYEAFFGNEDRHAKCELPNSPYQRTDESELHTSTYSRLLKFIDM